MDAFAVSIATGVNLKTVNFRQMFRLSWHFGLFQALMPIIGWSAGTSIRVYIERYDHWVAFGLLTFVGIGMIKEAFVSDKNKKPIKDQTRGWTLVMLSVATSIDALAVGFSISLLNVSIWIPALIIGIVAGVFSVVGLQIGQRIGSAKQLGIYAETIGGVVLIAIGLNILYEHGVLSAFLN
ncbi:MAG: manganese efflux pump [Deltaproteobacteria bacterium]|nr:manganese efflux pump [Deltaproteobacteria bacterium]